MKISPPQKKKVKSLIILDSWKSALKNEKDKIANYSVPM